MCASALWRESSDGKTSVVGVSAALNEFCVFQYAYLAVCCSRVHGASASELSHRQLTGVGKRAENGVTSAGDLDADRRGLPMMNCSVHREPKETFERAFSFGN
jgi:hypothetical protein